jgi:hypothetical protein
MKKIISLKIFALSILVALLFTSCRQDLDNDYQENEKNINSKNITERKVGDTIDEGTDPPVKGGTHWKSNPQP